MWLPHCGALDTIPAVPPQCACTSHVWLPVAPRLAPRDRQLVHQRPQLLRGEDHGPTSPDEVWAPVDAPAQMNKHERAGAARPRQASRTCIPALPGLAGCGRPLHTPARPHAVCAGPGSVSSPAAVGKLRRTAEEHVSSARVELCQLTASESKGEMHPLKVTCQGHYCSTQDVS